jgi:hypothetical protein
MEEIAVSIQEYVRRVKMPCSIAIASSRNTGKSVLCNQLIEAMYEQGKIDAVVLFSSTANITDDFPFVPENMKMPFSEDKLARLIAFQKEMKAKGEPKQLMIVFDDLLSDKSAIRNSLIMELYVSGRHFYTTPVLLSQSPSFILTNTIKGNTDLLFYSRLNRKALSTLWESLSNIDLKDFIKISETLNRDYRFLVINTQSMSPDMEDWLDVVFATLKK